jgi:ribosomal protein S6--L-glutamate ligase/tetrahydromethanopterin:alpha-L-glutamate ligase
LKIGILTRSQDAWCSSKLLASFRKKGVDPVAMSFSDLTATIKMGSHVSLGQVDLTKDVSAVLVRPIGRGSLDEVIFQMDMLHKLSRSGLPVINHPSAIEKAVDKYYALSILDEKGVSVPRTVVTESISEALAAFQAFAGEVVVKPVFGSRGIGASRISDVDVAERVFRTLRFYRHVIYVQEFVPHGKRDIRTFVVGGRVVAAMYRVSESWKTNVSQGATPVKADLVADAEEVALRATEAIGCEIAGVDLMESNSGLLVNEVNSQPGWRGLQTTTKVNIADHIAEYVLSKTRR